MYKVEPLVRRVWDETKGEVVETGLYGYQVLADDGRVLATGETRSEALEHASTHILLPKARRV